MLQKHIAVHADKVEGQRLVSFTHSAHSLPLGLSLSNIPSSRQPWFLVLQKAALSLPEAVPGHIILWASVYQVSTLAVNEAADD